MDYDDFKADHQDFVEPLVPMPESSPVAVIAEQMSRDQMVKQEFQEAEEKIDAENRVEYHGVKTTLFADPNTGIRYKLPTIFSPNPIARNVLSYLENTGFVHLLSIGQSGSGKTTWTKYLVHQLHMLKNFTVHWFFRDEIQKLDKIIERLQKGINHIIVLDDASFTLEELPKEQLNEVAKRLTYIRHEVKSDVIIIMNIHYSKAIKKFFRSVPFTFLTSINMEEVNSFQDVFGSYSRYKLRDFSRYYQQMMLKKQWTIELDKYYGKSATYPTNRPFRIGLANEVNHLHFFYYLKYACNICDPDHQTKRVINTENFVEKLTHSYNIERTRAMLKMYGFTKHGIKTLDSKRQSIWNTISELDRQNSIDWVDVIKFLDNNMTKKRTRSYIKKKQYGVMLDDIKDSLDQTTIADSSMIAGALQGTGITLSPTDSELDGDFIRDVNAEFRELESKRELVDLKTRASGSFGDDKAIDFGDGLVDGDGFNPEETDDG